MIPLNKNPPSRYPEGKPITEAKGLWWVAKVKPRMEKALAFDFIRHDIEYYLPLCNKTTRRKDNNKPRKSVELLFPGYIAFALEGAHRNIFITGRVVNLVEIKNQKRFMNELLQIQLALDNGVPIEPCTETFEQGTMVRVQRGPMAGIVGTVIKTQGGQKLILSVEGLGRASIAINSSLVTLHQIPPAGLPA